MFCKYANNECDFDNIVIYLFFTCKLATLWSCRFKQYHGKPSLCKMSHYTFTRTVTELSGK